MKKIYEDIKKVFDSKISRKSIEMVGVVVVSIIVFTSGVLVGFHKATFGREWSDNYLKNFGGRHSNRYGSFGMMNSFPNANGAVGKIIKIDNGSMVVSDKDGTEKFVVLTDDTEIHWMMNEIDAKDLKLNDYVVVVGSPNGQGQIEAKFIRIMPAPDFIKK